MASPEDKYLTIRVIREHVERIDEWDRRLASRMGIDATGAKLGRSFVLKTILDAFDEQQKTEETATSKRKSAGK